MSFKNVIYFIIVYFIYYVYSIDFIIFTKINKNNFYREIRASRAHGAQQVFLLLDLILPDLIVNENVSGR